MYDDLPQQLKQKVLDYLRADDFIAAKELHDSWMAESHSPMECAY